MPHVFWFDNFFSLGIIVKSLIVVLVAIGIVDTGSRGRYRRPLSSAAFRHAIVFCTLCFLLLLPIASFLLPALRLPPRLALSRVTSPAPLTAMGGDDAPSISEKIITSSLSRLKLPVVVSPQQSVSPVELLLDLIEISFVYVYLLVVVILLIRLLASLLFVAVQLRQHYGPPSESSTVHLAAQQGQISLPIHRPVALRIAKSDVRLSPVPMTIGLFRPVILLPREAEDWPVDRTKTAILHERTHIQRNDWLCQIFAEVTAAFYWYNPLVWYLSRRLRAEGEEAADDLVVASGMMPSEYAGHLLSIAEILRGARRNRKPQRMTVSIVRQPEVSRRVAAILSQTGNRQPLKASTFLLVGALALGVGLPLAALQASSSPTASSVRLPNGAMVAVLGVTSAQKMRGPHFPWWSVEGKKIASTPSPFSDSALSIWEGDGNDRVIAIQTDDVPQDAHIVIEYEAEPGGSGAYGLTRPRSTSRYYETLTGPVAEKKFADIEVGVASGEWKTVVYWKNDNTPGWMRFSEWLVDRQRGHWYNNYEYPETINLRFQKAVQKGSRVVLSIINNGPRLNWRVVALLNDGRVVPSVESRYDGDFGPFQLPVPPDTATFPNIRLGEVAQFAFQTRPYYYARFSKIELNPRK